MSVSRASRPVAGTVARMVGGRAVGFQQASKAMLRDAVLDAMRDLLRRADWAAVTMTDIAEVAGVSRQTVYNEFGSRQGLAQAYAERLVDEFCAVVGAAIARNEGSTHEALRSGFTDYFVTAAADPLVQSLLGRDAKPDLLRLITTDVAPLITRASGLLAAELESGWLAMRSDDAARVGRAIARMALSYIAMPPEDERDVAADLADTFAVVLDSARRPAPT